MGLISRKIFPACESMCVCCPALRSSSRQPVKRYKKSVLSHFSWRHSVAQKMTIFKLLLLVLVLEFSTESMAAPGCASNQTDSYDEFLLVLQWPASFCNTHECDNRGHIPDNFAVHGLWLNKESKPACCPVPRWLRLQNESIPVGMKNWWPDLKDQRNPRRFWTREYGKHGSCYMDQRQYFETARHIWNLTGDTRTMRLKSGKTLATQQYYQVSDFEYVTIANTTLYPALRCNYAVGTQDRHLQLLEIVFCTDLQLRPQRCSIHFNSCNGTHGFYFPPVTPPPHVLYIPRVTPPPDPWIDDQTSIDGQYSHALNAVFHQYSHALNAVFPQLYGGSPRMPAHNERSQYNGGIPRPQNAVFPHPYGGSPRIPAQNERYHPYGGSPRIPAQNECTIHFNSCNGPHGFYLPPVTPIPALWIEDQTSIDGQYCHAQHERSHYNGGIPLQPAHKRRRIP